MTFRDHTLLALRLSELTLRAELAGPAAGPVVMFETGEGLRLRLELCPE